MMVIVVALSCRSDHPVDQKEPEANPGEQVDITTMATPRGGKLAPAHQGPIRNALGQPEVDMTNYRLLIDGLVDSSFSLHYNTILQMRSEQTDTMLMYCVEGWEVWGVWKGISVAELLNKAKVNPRATHVVFYGIDGYSTAHSIKYLYKYNTILAYDVNGMRIYKEDGFPLRLIAPGLFGYKWAKYVNRLEAVNGSKPGFWEQRGYSDKAIVPLARRQYYEGNAAEPIEF